MITISDLKELKRVFFQFYRLVRRCCEDPDFYEGVRSVLVDRDGNPKWNPDSFQKVSYEIVDRYFSKLSHNEELSLAD